MIPLVAAIEAVALRWVWIWFDELWERGALRGPHFEALSQWALPLLEAIESGGNRVRDIVRLVEFLDKLEITDQQPR